MSLIRKVAVFGASGNFGAPITAALLDAGFQVTSISRPESTATFPAGVTVVRVEYSVEEIGKALADHDGAVCVVGPAGITAHVAMMDAAEAAGIKRFIINDFGWGPHFRSEPEFAKIGEMRGANWEHAKNIAERNEKFTWTGVTIGNPIDWALKRFPLMGFDVEQRSAVIYDEGTEEFTGTTLEGIGRAVVGIFRHPEETANRFVRVRSIQTSQNQLLEAFQEITHSSWTVTRSTTQKLKESGKRKHQGGQGGWVLDLLVYQLFEPGKARCVVSSRSDSDMDLLEVREETAVEVVSKVLK